MERFSCEIGIVSRIYNGKYELHVVKEDTGAFKEGDIYDLNAVYCRDVYYKKETIAITEINHVKGLKLHPLYSEIPLEAYISSPIIKNDVVWGTLNFSSFIIRDNPFSNEDIVHNMMDAKFLTKFFD